MERSFEGQTQATTAAVSSYSSLSDRVSMEDSSPDVVDQNGPSPETQTSSTTVPTTTSSSSAAVPSSNGDAHPKPRLAKLTGLVLQGQKTQPPSTATPSETGGGTPSIDSSDSQATSYFARSSARFDDDESGLRRTTSFGTVASTLNAHRRAATATAGGGASPPGSLTETDLRRFVFHQPRAKRLVSGLRVHAFTRQAFVSSFTVGLALGSVVAIILKIMKDIGSRMLYS